MSTQLHFSDMTAPPVDFDSARTEYEALYAALDAAENAEETRALIPRWDALRGQRYTWRALSNLRFNQDTTNADFRAERERCDALMPRLYSLDLEVMRRLIESPYRAELEALIGAKVFKGWAADLEGFSPILEEDMAAQSELRARYMELMAKAEFDVRGKHVTLSTLRKLSTSPDRSLRKEAQEACWGWFEQNGEALDSLFDEFVKLRKGMADKLGYPSFTELGYRWMHRLDYDAEDVERFRAQVREHVVPLATALREQQRQRLGVDTLYYWDEDIHDPLGEPEPLGDHDVLLDAAQKMFEDIDPELADFYTMMRSRGLLDLKARKGKSVGGFCTFLLDHEVPFVFANFNGTKGDVRVFTHELGHAFQGYSSRKIRPIDNRSPSADACEIHSMSLEFLSWPALDHLFAPEDVERFRKTHLTEALLFIPYGTAVDHFQHLIYANPEATPEERHAMWQEMERTYLPWRNYGDLTYLAKGGRWQLQRHIYAYPFYYIDYVLAQTCALQFWSWSRKDRDAAMKSYVALCARGGELPFQGLVRSAGLISPFEPGCLQDVVEQARAILD